MHSIVTSPWAVYQVLNLDFCTLMALPPSLGKLTALTTLDVEGNLYLGDQFRGAAAMLPAPRPAAAFPAGLSGLQSLRYFNLNSCGLTSVPLVRVRPVPLPGRCDAMKARL